MQQQQATPSQTIEALQRQLQEAQVQAYEASEAKRLAEERIRATKSALNGVQLGQKFAEEQAAEAEKQPEE